MSTWMPESAEDEHGMGLHKGEANFVAYCRHCVSDKRDAEQTAEIKQLRAELAAAENLVNALNAQRDELVAALDDAQPLAVAWSVHYQNAYGLGGDGPHPVHVALLERIAGALLRAKEGR